jgi:ankyrin repeat protein
VEYRLTQELIKKRELSQLLLHSVYNQDIDKVNLLLTKGVDPEAGVDVKGLTALHFAVEFRNDEIISLLLRHGANPHTRDKSGDTPYDYAMRYVPRFMRDSIVETYPNDKILYLLNTVKPDQDEEKNRKRSNYINLSLYNLDQQSIKKQYYAKMQKNDSTFLTQLLLHYVVWNEVPLVKDLLSLEVDPEVCVDQYGRTALHLAALDGNEEMVSLLLKYGANPKRADNEGLTAFDHAKEHPKILKLLSAIRDRDLSEEESKSKRIKYK